MLINRFSKISKFKRSIFYSKKWLIRVNTIDYISLWEEIHNQDFNLVEFDQIKTEYGRFICNGTNTMDKKNKFQRYYLKKVEDTILEFMLIRILLPKFASWLSAEFKLYLIDEFERLKANETDQEKIDWQANIILSKLNYVVHTDTVKTYIVPTLTEKKNK